MDAKVNRAGPLSAGDVRLLTAAGVLSAASGVTRFVTSGSVLPFVVSGLALAALGALVGRSVVRLGTGLGAGGTGVRQAALGNLPELFFGIFALRAGLVTVVQSALIGSILANVLLVMGVAFIAGGVRHGDQRFHADPARNMVLLMALAVAVLIIPTATANLHVPAADHEGALSNVLGGARLTLVLPLVLVVVLAITTVVVVIVVFDGKSNWLEGVTLVGLYGVIAASFWWG